MDPFSSNSTKSYSFKILFLLDVNDDDFKRLLQEDWATELTSNTSNAYKNKDYNDQTIPKLNHLIESWVAKRENITTGFESVFGKLFILYQKKK